MNILNNVLLVAAALFVISMIFICLGLFLNPKQKTKAAEPADTFDGYDTAAPEPPSAEDETAVDETAEDETAEDETAEDIDDTQDDNDIEPDGEADENGEDSGADDEPEKEPEKHSGIDAVITIIETDESLSVNVEDEILIGRNPQCDIVISRPMVSSVHCVLMREGKKLMVEDNNSTNGTLLNGKPLKHIIELKNNDVLTLGEPMIKINFN